MGSGFIDAYKEQHGKCPFCGSGDIRVRTTTIGDYAAILGVICSTCIRNWEEQYDLKVRYATSYDRYYEVEFNPSVEKEKYDTLADLVLRVVDGDESAMKEAKEFALMKYMGEEGNG